MRPWASVWMRPGSAQLGVRGLSKPLPQGRDDGYAPERDGGRDVSVGDVDVEFAEAGGAKKRGGVVSGALASPGRAIDSSVPISPEQPEPLDGSIASPHT